MNIFSVTLLFPLPGQEVYFEVPDAPDVCTVRDSMCIPPQPGNNPAQGRGCRGARGAWLPLCGCIREKSETCEK